MGGRGAGENWPVGSELSRSLFGTAGTRLTGAAAEPCGRPASARLAAARPSRARTRETRTAMRTVVAVATVAAVPARPAWTLLHPGVAAPEAAPSGLTNRELREAPLFLVPFDPRELCTNQRPMYRSLFDFNHTRLDRNNLDRLRNRLGRGFIARVPW
jgi:hypothetical protein